MSTSQILVVDDDPMSLLLLARIVELAGYQAATARNGQEALEKMRQLQPALVLIDAMMPQINGFEVCRQIRGDTSLPHQPYIIMLTGHDQAGDSQTHAAGVDEIINKPFNPAVVSERIQAILGQTNI